MKTKNIFKIILFLLISGFLLISLSGCSKSEVETSSNIDVDTQFDPTLVSINTILERTEAYKNADLIIKNMEFNNSSYTLNVFCSENNDRQIMNARDKRVAKVIAKYGSL